MFDADELQAKLPELRLELCKSTMVGMLKDGAIVSMVTQPDGFWRDFDHVARWAMG